MSLKILHISDIHFKYFKEGKIFDLDADLRNELELDMGRIVKDIGPIDLILIGGDIAFSGKDSEYEIANQWLKKVCEIVECRLENILMVPGNHDVDREKICTVLSTIQSTLKQCQTRKLIDQNLHPFLREKESAKILLKTFTNYENFAIRYGSVPIDPNPLFWEKDFPLGEHTLRIRGVNSAIISNKDDHEHLSKLILGSIQCQLERKKGIIYLFLCHHPPQWLYDQDEVEVALNTRAKIQLFGHKHAFNVSQIDQSLRLSAGALQPPKNEEKWDPRYNILDLDVVEKEEIKFLNVRVWKRVWNPRLGKFIKDDAGHGNFEEFFLKLSEVEGDTSGAVIKKIVENDSVMAENEKVETIVPQNPNPLRQLAYMFLSLPYHMKIEIAVELGLLDDEDQKLSEVEKSTAYFKRAQLQNKLEELWDKTVSRANMIDNPNPFTNK